MQSALSIPIRLHVSAGSLNVGSSISLIRKNPQPSPAAARLPLVLAELLVARGITQPDQAFAFLNPDISHLHDPFLMLGMAAAVERLEAAIARREPILLYGDYDVDGTTAVVLLKTAIEMLGGDRSASTSPTASAKATACNRSVLEAAYADGVRLVITVDTGMRAFAEAETAQRLGLDLIITDHHLAQVGRHRPRRARHPQSQPARLQLP